MPGDQFATWRPCRALPCRRLSTAAFRCCACRSCRRWLTKDLLRRSLQGGGDVLALDAGRVGGGSDQHEVVVHHLMAVHAEAVGHELFLKGGGVYEQHVDVAVLAVGEGFARAYGNPFQIDARVLFEDGLEIFQKAGVLRAGGGRHHQGFGVGHLGGSRRKGRGKL